MKPDLADDLRINVSRFLINYFVRFAAAGVIVYSCWIPIQNYNYWFSWHVILCTFGYLPLMAEAFMLFVGDELWSRQVSKKTKNMVHGILITVGSVMIYAGNSLCFHYLEPGYHLYTTHGITGLVSMILIFLSIICGYLAYYPQKFKYYVKPVTLKFIHNIIGLLAFIIGIISLGFGFYTHWFVYYTTSESRIVALVCTILVSAWSINGALVSAYNQIKDLNCFSRYK